MTAVEDEERDRLERQLAGLHPLLVRLEQLDDQVNRVQQELAPQLLPPAKKKSVVVFGIGGLVIMAILSRSLPALGLIGVFALPLLLAGLGVYLVLKIVKGGYRSRAMIVSAALAICAALLFFIPSLQLLAGFAMLVLPFFLVAAYNEVIVAEIDRKIEVRNQALIDAANQEFQFRVRPIAEEVDRVREVILQGGYMNKYPRDYCSSEACWALLTIVQNQGADSMKEAVKEYKEDLYRQTSLDLQNRQIEATNELTEETRLTRKENRINTMITVGAIFVNGAMTRATMNSGFAQLRGQISGLSSSVGSVASEIRGLRR